MEMPVGEITAEEDDIFCGEAFSKDVCGNCRLDARFVSHGVILCGWVWKCALLFGTFESEYFIEKNIFLSLFCNA